MLMAEQSFGLLRASGCLAFIVPVMFLHQQNAAVLRRMFLKTGAIERVVDLSSIEVFKDAIVKTAIFVVRKAQTRTDCDGISVYKPASARDLVTDGLLYEVEASRVLASPGLAFRTDLMPGSLDIIDRMMHQSVPFRQVLYPTFGLRPSPKQKGQGTKDRLLVEARVSEEAKPYVEGRDISRYDIRWPGRFVLYRPEEMYSARFPELFEFPKVLVRAVLSDKHLVATVDKEGYYADQTLVCSARPENVAGKADVGMAQPSAYSLHFVLAQLNSTLESFYFASVLTSDSLGGGAIHCTPGTTGELPIRSIDFSTPATDRQRLAGEARIQVAPVQNRVVASGVLGSDMPLDKAVLLRAAASILSWVEDRLSAQPEQTDVVHDLLAQLAEQMIEMNKARQSRVEAFWLDLEGVTDADAFGALRNKGKQESTLWKRAPCRPFVDQDSRSTRTLDESLGWNEKAFIAFVKALVRKVEGLSDLVRVYRAHAPAYRDLVARIAATDWLIDQIVYKLYRLTEDEIAIVEGRV